jgi:hypothetical protein
MFLYCTEQWSCSSWSSCVSSIQTRTCTDTNKCGSYNTLPITSQACSSGGGGGGSTGIGTIINTTQNKTTDPKLQDFIDMNIETNKYAYLENESINITVYLYFNYYDSQKKLQTRAYDANSVYFDILSDTSGYGRTYLIKVRNGVYNAVVKKTLEKGTYTIRAYAQTTKGTITEDTEFAITELEKIVNMVKRPKWWIVLSFCFLILILIAIGVYLWFKKNYKRI